jgi:hypothetical protein
MTAVDAELAIALSYGPLYYRLTAQNQPLPKHLGHKLVHQALVDSLHVDLRSADGIVTDRRRTVRLRDHASQPLRHRVAQRRWRLSPLVSAMCGPVRV